MNKSIDPMPHKGEVIIYQAKKLPHLEVRLDGDTVWLTQVQMCELFNRDRSVITKHIRNIFEENELQKKSVCANFAHTASDGKNYQVEYYNLDVVISVGYRVKSKEGTQFRIWATNVLRDHLLKGYTLNQKRLQQTEKQLQELREAIDLIESTVERKGLPNSDEWSGLFHVIRDYAYALKTLDDYDHDRLTIERTHKKAKFHLTYATARKAIDHLAQELRKKGEASDLFGREKDTMFRSAVESIYQTFGGQDLYPSIEEKAAHLLYHVVKNHGLVDGNKRTGAFLFTWFLQANGLLHLPSGQKRFQENTLVALTLMAAQSNPKEKDKMVRMVITLMRG